MVSISCNLVQNKNRNNKSSSFSLSRLREKDPGSPPTWKIEGEAMARKHVERVENFQQLRGLRLETKRLNIYASGSRTHDRNAISRNDFRWHCNNSLLVIAFQEATHFPFSARSQEESDRKELR